MVFNERVKMLRLGKSLTQTQVAEHSGMTLRAYQRLEAEAKPHYDNLLRLGEFFNVSVDWLMGRTDDRNLHR